MGATTLNGSGEMIFVFVGTPAYDAWCAHKTRVLGRRWRNQTSKNGRFGWFFPTLFPPPAQPPPETPQARDEEKPTEKTA